MGLSREADVIASWSDKITRVIGYHLFYDFCQVPAFWSSVIVRFIADLGWRYLRTMGRHGQLCAGGLLDPRQSLPGHRPDYTELPFAHANFSQQA